MRAVYGLKRAQISAKKLGCPGQELNPKNEEDLFPVS
jgi:hypothetical protein